MSSRIYLVIKKKKKVLIRTSDEYLSSNRSSREAYYRSTSNIYSKIRHSVQKQQPKRCSITKRYDYIEIIERST